MAFHFLYERLVGGQEGKPQALGQGHVPGIGERNSIHPGDGGGFSKEVPIERFDLKSGSLSTSRASVVSASLACRLNLTAFRM